MKSTLKFRAIYTQLQIAIASIGAVMGFAVHAAVVGPYPNDGATLHLWHFDETGAMPANAPTNALAYDVSTNLQTSPVVLSNTPGKVNIVGDTGYPPTEFALQGQPSWTNASDPLADFGSSVMTTNLSCLYPIPGSTMHYGDVVNTNTGAFTFEAMICPLVNPLAPGEDMEILCGDSGAATTSRAWQFRITTVGQLEFHINIGAPSGWIADVFAKLPTAGRDAAAAGNWYHVAVTYTGDTPTNGDTPKQLRYYWTLMDPTRTNDDLLWMTNLTAGITNIAAPLLAVGGNARGSVFNNVTDGEGFIGFLDEIRISDICRSSNGMMFNSTPFNESPTIVGLPTNDLVGIGQTLQLPATETGSQPITNQWYQDGVALPGQTTATLAINNITYGAIGNYELIAANSFGSSTSVVVTVTVGGTFEGLFNTGCGPNNDPLDQTAPGSIDQHWTIPVDPDPAAVGSEAFVWGDQAPVEPNGLIPENGASVWIGPEENSSSKTGGGYTYQTTFQVDETVVTNTVVSGSVLAANGVGGDTMQVFLNGQETDFIFPPNPTTSSTIFSITNGLQPGSNTLDIVAQYQSGNGYAGNTAFKCQITSDTGIALTNAPDIINEPVDTTNLYGSTVSLSAVALGAPPLYYQWLSNGVPVGPSAWVGTSLPSLSFVATNFSQSQLIGTNYFANYQVVFSNFVGSATSTVASVDVQIPPLTVASAGVPIWNPNNDETNIVVDFSGAVDPVTATTATNYTLNGATVVSATLGSAPGEVVLTTSVLNPASSYTLTVQNVNSSFGVMMIPSSVSIAVGTYPATVALWVKSGSDVIADGNGNVSQWNDLSGNGNNLMTGGSDPQLVQNALDGQPMVEFNGTNGTYLIANDAPSLKITGDMSVFVVVNFATLAGGTNGDIVSKVNNNNQPAPYDYYAQSGNVHFLRGNGSANGSVISTAGPSTGVAHILDVVMQGTNVTHRLDGNPNGSGTLKTSIVDQGQPLSIGAREDFHNFLTGGIAELILVGQALPSSDVASMESYLATEYKLPIGVTVSTVATNIEVSVANDQLTLSWPNDHLGWQLQAQTNSVQVGLSTNWVNVAGTTGTNQFVVPLNLTNGSVFFRLMYQP